MKSVNTICLTAALAFTAFAQDISVKSPDGRNEIRLSTEPVLSYSVLHDGKTKVDRSPIAMKVRGKPLLGGKVEPKACVQNSINGTIATPIYKKSSVSLAANEMKVDFGDWGIVLNARNDGVAYRFTTEFPGEIHVEDETASVKFPSAGTTVYSAIEWGKPKDPLQNSWESIYTKHTVADVPVKPQHVTYLPVMAVYEDGSAMEILESDLLNYPGWNLARSKDDPSMLETFMAKYPDQNDIKDDHRGRHFAKRLDYLAKTTGSRTFPWRVFALADKPEKLIEADIVYALATPSRLGDSSWVKPGKVAWDWWNDFNISGVDFKSGVNTKTYKYYIDFASSHGIEYVIMDEGWSVKLNIDKFNPDVNVPEIVRYARGKGVDIILWCSWPQLIGRQREVFKRFADIGVKGFKIDFMDRDDQYVVDYLEETAKIAAEFNLMVDYHGMFKPTGLSRTYPNVINYEGVHGLEQLKWEEGSDFPLHDVRTAFTRMVAGPMDYTPGAMINSTKAGFKANFSLPGSQGTRVHQMALMSLYEAPLQMLCDSPTRYMKNAECTEFMAKVPTVWDETVAVCGNPDKYIVIARRHGEVWYLSAIGNWDEQDVDVTCSFLGDGKWCAEAFEDGVNTDRDATDYVVKCMKLTKDSKVRIHLGPGGGFTARIEKACWLKSLFL